MEPCWLQNVIALAPRPRSSVREQSSELPRSVPGSFWRQQKQRRPLTGLLETLAAERSGMVAGKRRLIRHGTRSNRGADGYGASRP